MCRPDLRDGRAVHRDAWEAGHGLDPRAQDHNGDRLSLSLLGVAGYTNLECYLAELARERLQAGR